ncbi:Lipase maturation factor 2 [Phytophthora pseudosyringae]|uniref:Lipase maturation factor 2 n=1 Tax=Phytophthora pseudosyringae TaxID=221518 RepID=A0A8T1WC48_9STRA|nr:Lipase maturation factor 2 [Phytophthora pseudosyringae]
MLCVPHHLSFFSDGVSDDARRRRVCGGAVLGFPREPFLICICAVHAAAFASIRTQLRGLYDTQTWFALLLPRCTVFSAVLAACSSSWQLCASFLNQGTAPRRHLVPGSDSRCGSLSLTTTVVNTVGSMRIFTNNAGTLSVLAQSFQQSLPPFAVSTYYSTEKYRVTSAYGLFRTMPGVGTVQLDNGQRLDRSYHFQYKPGDVDPAPRLVVRAWTDKCGLPRWAATHDAPWLLRLMEGSPDVRELLDATRVPFPDTPPDAIRAQLFYYDFTWLKRASNQAAKIVNNSSEQQQRPSVVDEDLYARRWPRSCRSTGPSRHLPSFRRRSAHLPGAAACSAAMDWSENPAGIVANGARNRRRLGDNARWTSGRDDPLSASLRVGTRGGARQYARW